jgi:hypothetical protein
MKIWMMMMMMMMIRADMSRSHAPLPPGIKLR